MSNEEIKKAEDAAQPEKKAKKELTTEERIKLQRKKRLRKRRIKKLITWIIVLVILTGAVRLYRFRVENMRWPWQSESMVLSMMAATVTDVEVVSREYDVSIDISGAVEPYETQKVMLKTSGTINAVLVKEGDSVKKGDLLATVDDTDAQYSVETIKSQIEAAKFDGNASELKLLEMKLDSALKVLDNTKLYANFDGVVTAVNAQENDYFTAGSTVITIIDNSKLKATVEVDEIDVQYLSVGMKAVLTADSAPGQTMEARISYIPIVGRYSSTGIGVMDVEIVLDEFPSSFKPGFSFEGTIAANEPVMMLLVPQNSVTNSGGEYFVEKKAGDSYVKTPIQAKYLGEGYYQVLAGDLYEGDLIKMTTASNNVISSFMRSL